MAVVREPGKTRDMTMTASLEFAHDPPILNLQRYAAADAFHAARLIDYRKEFTLPDRVFGDPGVVSSHYTQHGNVNSKLNFCGNWWAEPWFWNRRSRVDLMNSSSLLQWTDNGDGTVDAWLHIVMDVEIGILQGFQTSAQLITDSIPVTVNKNSSWPGGQPGNIFNFWGIEMTESEALTGIIMEPSEGDITFNVDYRFYKVDDSSGSTHERYWIRQYAYEGTFTFTITLGPLTHTDTVSFSFTSPYFSIADNPTFLPDVSRVADHRHELLFTCGPSTTISGSVAFSDTAFNNESDEDISISTDFLEFLGTPQQGSLRYTGIDFQTDCVLAPDDPSDGTSSTSSTLSLRSTLPAPPSARIYASPSWSVSIYPYFVNYEDASTLDMRLVHKTWHQHTGGTIEELEEWDARQIGGAVNPLLMPSSGYLDMLVAEITSEGQCYRYGEDADPDPGVFEQRILQSWFTPETEVGHAQSGQVNRPWALLDTPYEIPAGEAHLATTHFFYISDTYANDNGYYLKSYNKHLRYLNFGLSQRFPTGQILVPEVKTFALFDLASGWVVPNTSSAFYTSNPDVSGVGTKLQVGGTTRFFHAAGGARALFRNESSFKPFSHRYFRIYYLAEGAGEKYRFGVGRLPFGAISKYYWRYAWEWESPASGWQTFTFDWLYPTHEASVDGSGVVTVVASNAQIHPSSFLEGADKATTAWVEMITTGQVDIDRLEGFLEVSGTRTPALMYHGMLVSGSQVAMSAYEPGILPASTPYFLIYSPNGASGIGVTGSGAISSVWSGVRTQIGHGVGSNDTGFTVTLPTHALAAMNLENNEDFGHFVSGMFGEEMTPGVALQCYQRLRVQGNGLTHSNIFYGMGDVDGAYGPAILLRSVRLINGEVRMVVPGASSGDGFTLHDNPTEVNVATAVVDDDASARAVTKYGVPKPRLNTASASSTDDPLEYSGAGPPYTYGAYGELLNSYWFKALGWTPAEVDDDDYLAPGDVRQDVTVLDGWPNWLITEIPDTIIGGIDVANSPGGVHVTKLVGNEIQVQNSYDRGYSWTTVVVATTTDDASLPTIYRDPETDWLYVLFHSATEVLGYVSKDVGQTWTLHSDSLGASAKWPRGSWAPEAHYRAVWLAGDLLVYRTEFDEAGGFVLDATISGVPEQVPEVFYGRGHCLHVLWHAEGDVIWRRTKDRGVWKDAEIVTTGARLPVTMGNPGGTMVMVYTTAGALIGFPTEADLVTLRGGSFTLPDLSEEPQYVGLSFDHFGVAWLVVKLTDGSSSIRWSKDRGANWHTL